MKFHLQLKIIHNF